MEQNSQFFFLQIICFQIYSIDGKEVSSFNDTTKINLSHFKDGIYFLKIKDGAHTVTKKIIKI